MAGHNRWSKVKHRKAVVDKRRGKAWTKISKAIIVAAKHGGPDPNFNHSLRFAIDEARYANMPRDVVERAIKKGAGGEDTGNYETIRYECYGPGGVAIIVDALTDNRARTAGDVRLAFSTHGGNVGATGCVSYMFQPRGRIRVSAVNVTEEKIMEAAINAGALDVEPPAPDDGEDDAAWVVLTEPSSFLAVKDSLESTDFKVLDAELAMIAENTVSLSGDEARSFLDLVDALEELDDVQKVHSNARIVDG